MKPITNQRFAKAALFSLMALSMGTAFAQDARESRGPISAQTVRPPAASNICHCSNPVNVLVVKNAGPTSAVPADFIVPASRVNESPYNGTQVNKFFSDTLTWTMPKSNNCELKGTVMIRVKNLGTISSNDSVGVWQSGKAVPGYNVGGPANQLWGGQGSGAIKTLTYPLTPAMMQLGRLSVFVQDDTAVQEIKVQFEGCCIERTPI